MSPLQAERCSNLRLSGSVFQLQSAPKAHDRKVALIQKQVREWNQGDKSRKMCTARAGYLTMSFRFPSYKANLTLINTNKLVDILEAMMTIQASAIRVGNEEVKKKKGHRSHCARRWGVDFEGGWQQRSQNEEFIDREERQTDTRTN